MRYSIQPTNRLFIKGYAFLSFGRNMGENVGKNISKNLSSKHSQKLLDHVRKSTANTLKTALKRVIQKTAEAKLADIIREVLKTSQNNHSETKKKYLEKYLCLQN